MRSLRPPISPPARSGGPCDSAVRGTPYTHLDNELIYAWAKGLTLAEFMVAVVIRSMDWTADRPAKVSVGALAKRCELGKTTVHRAVSSLTQRGILVPVSIGSGHGPSAYHVDLDPAFRQGNAKESHEGNASVPRGTLLFRQGNATGSLSKQ